ncbi:hypothetical protein NSMM_1030001 [Nitrosomonas mobilis]|uniref:Uncharacterized protein n=1 Tax=Nitrosomonas mobilis TaxID=51642 RepID=A0A1G5SCH2_9PROT|nr:hypothetical protein NSMM_1030001 [Nitrosomonas mobilis]
MSGNQQDIVECQCFLEQSHGNDPSQNVIITELGVRFRATTIEYFIRGNPKNGAD